LAVELADNDCWDALLQLAKNAGEDTAAEEFAVALVQEQEQLAKARGWLAAAQGR